MMEIAAYLTALENVEVEMKKIAKLGPGHAKINNPVAVHSEEGELLGYLVRQSGAWRFTQDPL